MLPSLDALTFQLENGASVPAHFHVTEVGLVTKHFIDCGGTVRHEQVVNFQLWNANDYDHRLEPSKLLKIIELSEQQLGISDALDIEVEYQTTTIGKYSLEAQGDVFVLTNKQTACLAMDSCGIPSFALPLAKAAATCCTPGGDCC